MVPINLAQLPWVIDSMHTAAPILLRTYIRTYAIRARLFKFQGISLPVNVHRVL